MFNFPIKRLEIDFLTLRHRKHSLQEFSQAIRASALTAFTEACCPWSEDHQTEYCTLLLPLYYSETTCVCHHYGKDMGHHASVYKLKWVHACLSLFDLNICQPWNTPLPPLLHSICKEGKSTLKEQIFAAWCSCKQLFFRKHLLLQQIFLLCVFFQEYAIGNDQVTALFLYWDKLTVRCN